MAKEFGWMLESMWLDLAQTRRHLRGICGVKTGINGGCLPGLLSRGFYLIHLNIPLLRIVITTTTYDIKGDYH